MTATVTNELVVLSSVVYESDSETVDAIEFEVLEFVTFFFSLLERLFTTNILLSSVIDYN